MNKAAHSGFETQRRHHEKSKTGVLVASTKFLFKNSDILFFKNFFLILKMEFWREYVVTTWSMDRLLFFKKNCFYARDSSLARMLSNYLVSVTDPVIFALS